jgi:phage terminase large subunit
VPYDFTGVVDNTLYIHSTYLDNLDHLSKSYLKQINKIKEKNLIKYEHIFLGKWNSSV